MNVLVTGIASDIGFGIGRIMNEWSIFNQIHGIDITDDHPGGLLFDFVAISPRADTENYINWICGYLQRHKIGLFIPTSEAEILLISRNSERFVGLTHVLINDPILIEICLDKHKTLEFLGSKGMAVPLHGLVGIDAPKNFPVIIKPRRGQGSKGVKTLYSNHDFNSLSSGQVWQEQLIPENQEYTCAVYVDPNLDIKCLQIKRTLIGGYTGKGELFKNHEISSYLEMFVDIFKFPGCFNVQLRLTDNGPLLFEINPRLSSTLVFRDKLGFTDLRWWVCDTLGYDKPPYIEPVIGTKIYRGSTEYIQELG